MAQISQMKGLENVSAWGERVGVRRWKCHWLHVADWDCAGEQGTVNVER
jgi:hypothetical protein